MSFPRYPKYKASGVEWLGEVPEHWTVTCLRQFGQLLKGSGGSKEDVVDTGLPCVRYGDLYTTHDNFIREARTRVSPERAWAYTQIRYGDVLFAGSGETFEEIGKSAVNLMTDDARCGGDLILFRPTLPVNPTFIGYACDSHLAASQKAMMGRGTTVKHIYPDELRGLTLSLPPLSEQGVIGAFLDSETGKIDTLVAEIIEKLNDLFQGELTDQDKLVYVNNVIKGKLLESTTLQQQAAHNTKEQFASSPDLNTELLNAIMGALDAHTLMSTQALNSESVRRGLKDILLNHTGLYEDLRGSAGR